MVVQIYIEGQRLDLFEDDNITIQSVVKDIDDLSLKADFSQSFNVPASSNNNNIFKRYYNFDVDNGFDARTRKLCTIDVDTLDFKRGKMRLDRVKMKNGQPESYQLTFFGDAIKLKDLIGEDKLNTLSWLDNFNHDYTDTNVRTGLTTGLDFTVDGTLYEKAIIYPLISYTKQYLYNSDPSDTTNTDTLVNIAYDAGRTQGIDFTDLKPAIRLDLMIKAIEEKYGFTFTGNFFDTEQYKQAYVNLSTDVGILANGVLEYDTVSGTVDLDDVPSAADVQIQYRAIIQPNAGFESVPYRVEFSNNGTVIYESDFQAWGDQTFTANILIDVAAQGDDYDYDFTATVITESDFEFDADQRLRLRIVSPFSNTDWIVISNNSYSGLVIDLQSVITSQVQDIKTYDFLTSVIRMYHLITTPTTDGDLYFNDLQSWYSEGQIYDITPYIDTTEKTVNRGKLYNQIDFKFAESEQILADFYKQENKRGFGDIEQRLFDASGEPLDGDKLDINVIFENPVFERLYDLNADITSIQYCLMLKEDLNQYVGAPFLFFAPSVSITGNSIGFNNLSSYQELNSSVFMPSHSMQIDTPSFNLHFNAEVNEYVYEVFEDTIYKRYYEDFITDVFSIKRRSVSFEGILPLALLHRLRLNDRLVIQDTRYIINKIDSNIVNRLDRFDLVNDIYDAPLASDSLNTSVFRNTSQLFNGQAHSFTANYIGLDNQTATRVDAGDGTTWVTVTNPKSVGASSEITFTIDENNTGAERRMYIQVTDGLNNPRFVIIQEAQGTSLNFSNEDNSGLIAVITGIV